jgi:hypothetical protein
MKKRPGDDECDKLRARRMTHERSLGKTARGEDKRISIADAADFLGTPDAAGLIERASKLGTVRLRGVRPGETEPVEIPADENGKLDCVASLIGDRLFTGFQTVTIAWVDVKWMAQADVNRQAQDASTHASPPQNQAAQSAPNADILEARVGRVVKAVALELRRHYPDGRPAFRVSQLMQDLKEKAGKRLGVFEKRTLERAIALAWTRANGRPAPKQGKARQI